VTRKRKAGIAVAAVAAVAAGIATLAPNAQASSACDVKYFKSGDKVYVKDLAADGKAINWYASSNYGKKESGKMTRGAGHSRTYNFNFKEHRKLELGGVVAGHSVACDKEYSGT
jgi:uncharacterized low-complexity protein